MLQEIASTHRINHRKPKRWFTDADMDLFIWFKNNRPVCFQFSYNKRQREHSISWHVESGFSHSLVRPDNRQNKYKVLTSASPECECQCSFDAMTIARQFLQASDGIQTSLADFIFARLLEAPAQLERRSNQALVSVN